MSNRAGLLLIAGLAACGDGGHPSAMGVIGASGGEVQLGAASVTVPPGALMDGITITVTTTEPASSTDEIDVGTGYLFGPEGLQFAVPVTITLAFDAGSLQAEDTAADVVIDTAPAGSTAFEPLTTSVVGDSLVSAQSSHFSVFVPRARKRKPHEDAGVDTGDQHDAAIDAAPDAPADAAVACTPMKGPNGSIQFCNFSATCGGHAYTLTCSGSSCGCSIDGSAAQNVNNVGTTCQGTSGQPGWGACGFP